MAKKPSLTEQIAALKGGKTTPALENRKIDNNKDTKPPTEKKLDGRRNNRGHPGSGRKPGGLALQNRIFKAEMKEALSEMVTVRRIDPKTKKEVVVEIPAIRAQIMRLYRHGEAHYQAIDLWLNRAVGKAPQPIVGDEDEDAIRINNDMLPILKKAYGRKS